MVTPIDEEYFTLREVAEKLKISEKFAKRIFSDEPGVVVLGVPQPGRRTYHTYRVPQSVLRRVLTRLSAAA